MKETELARSERGTQAVRCHDGHADRAAHSELRTDDSYHEPNAFSGTGPVLGPVQYFQEADILLLSLERRGTCGLDR